MARSSQTVKLAKDITAAVSEVRRYAPKEIRRETGLIARGPISLSLIRRLGRDPGHVKYPYDWQTHKQRAAYFATDGFGRGIPTRRTGAEQRGWDVKVGEGSTILVENDREYSSYVQGADQQSGHVQTGWENVDDVLPEYVPRYENAMIDGWFRVVDRLEKRAK